MPFLRAGLTAYVHAFAGRAPAPQKAHAGTLARMQRGEPPNCLPAFVEQSAVNARDDTDLALSFFAYLATTYGVPALQRFLQAYTPQNPDQAAVAAFQKPLATLQEEWLGSVATLLGGEVGIGDFFRRLAPYLKPYPFQLVEIMVYLLFAVGFGMALQGSQKFLIDNVIGPPAARRRAWCSSPAARRPGHGLRRQRAGQPAALLSDGLGQREDPAAAALRHVPAPDGPVGVVLQPRAGRATSSRGCRTTWWWCSRR